MKNREEFQVNQFQELSLQMKKKGRFLRKTAALVAIVKEGFLGKVDGVRKTGKLESGPPRVQSGRVWVPGPRVCVLLVALGDTGSTITLVSCGQQWDAPNRAMSRVGHPVVPSLMRDAGWQTDRHIGRGHEKRAAG